MFKLTSLKTPLTAIACVCLLATAPVAMAQQDTAAEDRVFIEKAPTPDEFVDMLFSSSNDEVTTRGIQMHSSPEQETKTASTPSRIVAAPVRFGFNSDTIPTEFEATLLSLAKALSSPEAEGQKLHISGHTDPVGSDAFNMELSQRRAEAVGAFLRQNGVAADRIETQGLGETALVSDDHAKNRRVEFQAKAQ